MKELCEWLKHQVKLATTPVRDEAKSPRPTPSSRGNQVHDTPPSSLRPTRRYAFDVDTASSEKKRKISWEDILHPLKSRRLEKEERQPLYVVRGSFSLHDIQGAKFPGKQTTATSLCAILQSKSLAPNIWTTEVVDRLLLQGDKLHSTRVVHLEKHKSGHTDLIPEELPEKIAVSEKEYSLKYRKLSKDIKVKGPWKKNKEDAIKTRYKKLCKLLKTSLHASHAGALLTTYKDTIGLFRDGPYCYLFHPCKPSTNLFSVNDHEAVLSRFRDPEHLATYLCHKFVKSEASYNLSVVDFNVEFDIWTQVSFAARMPLV